MSTDPVGATQRASSPLAAREAARPQAHPDARSLAEEFGAAARKGALPLNGRTPAAGKDARPLRLGPDGRPIAPPAGNLARMTGSRGEAREALGETRRDDSATAMLLPGPVPGGFATPMQAPVPAAAHVDPGAFADMLTRIWSREQGKTAREVRVSFGDAAWPATGARLLRLDDGSLRVTVSVGQRHSGVADGLEGLRERLVARGLNVADIGVEEDV